MTPPDQRPRIGLIVPPAEAVVPPEASAMYGEDIDFVAGGLALSRLTPDGYDAVQQRLGTVAAGLRDAGAQAVALMGTSLSFYKGAHYNRTLTRILEQATGLPAVTMSTAIVQALQASGCRRLAVATAYADAVNDRLRAFLVESGFEVLSLEALAIEDVAQVAFVRQDELHALAGRALDHAPQADGLLISCGGLRTLEVSERVQHERRLPVVSSSAAGPWAAARLVGHSGRAPGAPWAGRANADHPDTDRLHEAAE